MKDLPTPSGNSMQTKDARQRHRYTFLAELAIVYEGASEEIPVALPNISPQGMFINTLKQLPVGAILKVRFRLSRSGAVVHTRAEVRYCLPDVGIGIEFLEISPKDRRAIEEEIQRAGLGRSLNHAQEISY